MSLSNFSISTFFRQTIAIYRDIGIAYSLRAAKYTQQNHTQDEMALGPVVINAIVCLLFVSAFVAVRIIGRRRRVARESWRTYDKIACLALVPPLPPYVLPPH